MDADTVAAGHNSYDDVSYGNVAFPQTHPDRLATVGRLFGLPTPSMCQRRKSDPDGVQPSRRRVRRHRSFMRTYRGRSGADPHVQLEQRADRFAVEVSVAKESLLAWGPTPLKCRGPAGRFSIGWSYEWPARYDRRGVRRRSARSLTHSFVVDECDQHFARRRLNLVTHLRGSGGDESRSVRFRINVALSWSRVPVSLAHT